MTAIAEVGLRSKDKESPTSQIAGESPVAGLQDDAALFEQWFICRQCKRRIASSGSQIIVQGQHQHVFVNASGIVFEIACYSTAQGFSYSGNPSTDFSWFPGYAWRIILCAGCLLHLGWMFSGKGGTAFFGLITDRVVMESTPGQ